MPYQQNEFQETDSDEPVGDISLLLLRINHECASLESIVTDNCITLSFKCPPEALILANTMLINTDIPKPSSSSP